LSVTEIKGHLYINSVEYGIVATPVPEPSTILILSLGSVFLTNKKRKKTYPR